MTGGLRSLWTRYWLRKSKFTGRYDDLRRLYVVEDPWKLSSTREQLRFTAANGIIRTLMPHCESLLELGCGEGMQTSRLLEVSRTVAGIDVSEKAIARARVRCPDADLRVGRAEDAGRLFAKRRFDIVTAFEVLYYSDDIPKVLREVQTLTDRLLVTNYNERSLHVEPHFLGSEWQRLDNIVAHDVVWTCHLWQRPGTPHTGPIQPSAG